jgi:hypothetical protein
MFGSNWSGSQAAPKPAAAPRMPTYQPAPPPPPQAPSYVVNQSFNYGSTMMAPAGAAPAAAPAPEAAAAPQSIQSLIGSGSEINPAAGWQATGAPGEIAPNLGQRNPPSMAQLIKARAY